MATNQTMGPTDLNKAVKMIKKEEKEGFFIQDHKCLNKDHIFGEQHAHDDTDPGEGDGPCSPHGFSDMNTYTVITIAKGIKVTQVIAMNVVPKVEVVLGTLEKLDEIQGIQQPRMSVEQRKEILFHQLELSVLEWWSDKNQATTHALLAEYHDIFSLEPGELGCSDLVKHEIRVIDGKPFKERFWRIPTYDG